MTPKEAKKIARKELGDYRFEHSCNVAKAAAKLAKKYGADVETAKIAGYLHDVMKERPKSDLLQMIVAYDKIDSAEIECCPALYHAFAGGIYVREQLNLSEEISDAIRYHTTGRKGMTLLDKIIYLADYISEERSFEGVDGIRKLAKKSLDKALFGAMRNQIIHLAQNSAYIDQRSFDAYNDLLLNGDNR